MTDSFNFYKPVTLGGLSLCGNLFLAPVAGYSDRSFRSLCVEFGADFTFTELISAEALYRNPGRYGLGDSNQNQKEQLSSAVSLVSKGENEKHYAVQLFSSDPSSLYKAAVLLKPLNLSVLYINAGCPVPKVVKNGSGAALMKTPLTLGKMVEAAVK
jgi:tRNA-dihydrouridine synthase